MTSILRIFVVGRMVIGPDGLIFWDVLWSGLKFKGWLPSHICDEMLLMRSFSADGCRENRNASGRVEDRTSLGSGTSCPLEGCASVFYGPRKEGGVESVQFKCWNLLWAPSSTNEWDSKLVWIWYYFCSAWEFGKTMNRTLWSRSHAILRNQGQFLG